MQKYYRLRDARRNGEGGFTLIELLVVMVIIGILAAIAIPLFLNQKEKAKVTGLKNDLRNAATYAESYAVDHDGRYTATVGGTAFNINDNAAVGDDAYGFKPSANTTALSSATGTSDNAFCIQGTAGGETWSYDSDRATQLAKLGC